MAEEPFIGDPEDLMEQEEAALMAENPEAIAPVEGQAPAPTQQDPNSELSDEAKTALINLVDRYERDEEEYRDHRLREWKLMEHFWNDNQHNIWSETAQDWRPIEEYGEEDDLDLEGFEPRTVNIYRGHGESVIAALSAGIPVTHFLPNDADSQDDVTTAKVHTRAAELLHRRNKAALLIIRSLYILWNQGVVACYNYSRTDPKLGTVIQPINGLVNQKKVDTYCPNCGMDMQGPQGQCPECGYEGDSEIDKYDEQVPGVVGEREFVRITEDQKVYSPLYFTIPHWATSQEECPFITLNTEQSPGAVIAAFQEDVDDIREKVKPTKDDEKYDRWARKLDTWTEPNLVTVRQRWVRSWGLEEIEEESVRNELLQKFPDGVYFVQCNDEFVTARNENMDDHWTISMDPTSTHLLSQPKGRGMKNVQEMTNELVTMTLDNIEHGTPMTFIDKEMISLRQFKKSRVVPGSIYPVQITPGQALSNYIHETKPATLSDEVRHFQQELKEFGQFVSGAYPSIYGGAIQGGSGTADEYNKSRLAALQRLQIMWRIVSEWWTEMTVKSVKDYLSNLKYDERFVKPHGKNGYINVWIRKSELTGQIGEVLAESSEQFPISNAQKRDIILNMLTLQNPNVDAALFHPENVGVIAQTVGFPELYIPGDDDRSKQLNEIAQLLTGAPMPMLDQMGMPQMIPTVQPDMDFDNHPIHMETIKAFAVSEVGQQVKLENPMGYQNMLAHYKMHEQMQMMQMMKQGMLGGIGGGEEAAPEEEGTPEVPAPSE